MTGKDLIKLILDNDAVNFEIQLSNDTGDLTSVETADMEVDPDEETVTINTQ